MALNKVGFETDFLALVKNGKGSSTVEGIADAQQAFAKDFADVLNKNLTDVTEGTIRASISSSITAINYNSTTGQFTLSSGYTIPSTTEVNNWNTAYTTVMSLGTMSTQNANAVNITGGSISVSSITNTSISDTHIIYSVGGVMTGSSAFTYNYTNNRLNIGSYVSAAVNNGNLNVNGGAASSTIRLIYGSSARWEIVSSVTGFVINNPLGTFPASNVFTINSSTGYVGIGIGNSTAISRLNVSGNVIFESADTTSVFPSNPSGRKFIFVHNKGALIGGTNGVGGLWSEASTGLASIAWGEECRAPGEAAVSLGYGSYSSGFASIAIGTNGTASGSRAISLGAWMSTSTGVTIGGGTSTTYLNNTSGNIWMGLNSDTSTFVITAASGVGKTGNVGVAINLPTAKFHVSGEKLAVSGWSRGVEISPSLVATANGDILASLYFNTTFTAGSFTGVTNYAIYQATTVPNYLGGSLMIGANTTLAKSKLFHAGSSTDSNYFNYNGGTASLLSNVNARINIQTSHTSEGVGDATLFMGGSGGSGAALVVNNYTATNGMRSSSMRFAGTASTSNYLAGMFFGSTSASSGTTYVEQSYSLSFGAQYWDGSVSKYSSFTIYQNRNSSTADDTGLRFMYFPNSSMSTGVGASNLVTLKANGAFLINATAQNYTEKFRVNGTSYFDDKISINTSFSSAWISIGSCSTSIAHINLIAGAIPSSPFNGDIWFTDVDLFHFHGRIETKEPSANGAGRWKLGTVVSGAVTVDAANYVEIELNGSVIKLVKAT